MLGLGSLDLMRRRGMSRAPFMASALGMRRGPAGMSRPRVGMPSTPAAQGIPQGLSQLGTTAVAQPPQGAGMYQDARSYGAQQPGNMTGPSTTAVGTPKGTYDSATGAFTPFPAQQSGSDAPLTLKMSQYFQRPDVPGGLAGDTADRANPIRPMIRYTA